MSLSSAQVPSIVTTKKMLIRRLISRPSLADFGQLCKRAVRDNGLRHCKTALLPMPVGLALSRAKISWALCESKPLKLNVVRGKAGEEGSKASNESHFSLLVSLLQRNDWILLALSATCSIVASLLTTVQARVIGKIFDSLGQTNLLQVGLVRLLLVFISQAALSFLSTTALSFATTNLGVRLRVKFFRAILSQDMSVIDQIKTGELTHQLSQDVASLQTAIRESFTRGVESITSLISGSVLLYTVSPSMSLYLLGLLPLGAVGGSLLGESLRELSKQSRGLANKATGLAAESISSIRTVRSFASEDREVLRYEHELNDGASVKAKMAILTGAFYSSIGLGINLTTLLICGWGHQLIEQGKLTKGDLATIATQVQLLERSLARLSVLSASLSKAMKGAEHVFHTIQVVPVVNRACDEPVMLSRDRLRGDIALHTVSFSYPGRKDAVALDNLSIECKRGEVVALVGASGAGKSTVFQLVERFYDPDSGSITVDGVDIRRVDPLLLRRMIGYVHQKPDLFSGTIEENIKYGLPEATHAQVLDAARRANAHDFIASFPDGYATKLGDSGIGLSGGQRQRIAIARTLLLDPKILLLGTLDSCHP
jgi:ATP-binding cassette, subfamily B (MDR/TAP), member 8